MTVNMSPAPFERHRTDAAEDFHEASKITRIPNTGWSSGFFGSLRANAAAAHELYGQSTSCPRVSTEFRLDGTEHVPMSISEALRRRRSSSSDWLSEPLDLASLGCLLKQSYSKDDNGRRPCPSGGGLYPLDLYTVATRVNGLEEGLYQLDPLTNSLWSRPADLGVFREAALDFMQPVAVESSASICITASFDRSRYKYGQRGYRLCMLEAGHVAQNLLLLSTGLGLPAIGWVGFVDHEMDDFLGLDGVTQSILYVVSVGGPYVEE